MSPVLTGRALTIPANGARTTVRASASFAAEMRVYDVVSCSLSDSSA